MNVLVVDVCVHFCWANIPMDDMFLSHVFSQSNGMAHEVRSSFQKFSYVITGRL